MTTYIDTWYATRAESREIWGYDCMPVTYEGIRRFQMKFGVGQLCNLFGSRGFCHLLNYSRLSRAVYNNLKSASIPDLADTYTEAQYNAESEVDENEPEYLYVPYRGTVEAVREALMNHLDDHHDLYQNFPYQLRHILEAYPDAFDADVFSDSCIIAALICLD